jgi:hypothetical protein
LHYGSASFRFRTFRLAVEIKIKETVVLPVVPYGCEIWSLTLKEEDTLRVCENRVLRRIFKQRRG